ncbi:hypothetical protein HanIR_Chr09g0405811 [Helianthus annuus]|nr:hypothetical protein HanIR_Chr09g0405811 [Helianthus annuus]
MVVAAQVKHGSDGSCFKFRVLVRVHSIKPISEAVRVDSVNSAYGSTRSGSTVVNKIRPGDVSGSGLGSVQVNDTVLVDPVKPSSFGSGLGQRQSTSQRLGSIQSTTRSTQSNYPTFRHEDSVKDLERILFALTLSL